MMTQLPRSRGFFLSPFVFPLVGRWRLARDEWGLAIPIDLCSDLHSKSSQPDPVDSTKMISAANHGCDEQHPYESGKYKDGLDEELKEEFKPPTEWLVLDLEQQSSCSSLKLPKPQKSSGSIELLKLWAKMMAHGHHEFLRMKMKMKRKDLWDFQHNIVINNDLFERCDPYFLKYIIKPLGIRGLQHLPDDQAYLQGFPGDGTSQVSVDGINTYFRCTIQTPKYLRKGSCSEPFDTSTNTTANGNIPATPGPGDNGFVVHSANSKRNHVRKNIFMLSRARDGGSSSEGTGFTLSGGNNHHRETDSPSNDMPEFILDSQAQANCTGNFNVLSNLSMGRKNVVLVAANGQEMATYISGSVRLERFELHDVHYCPDLEGNRIIVSGSMLDIEDYYCRYGRGKCSVTDLRTGRIVGEGRLVDRNYILEYLKIPRDRTPGLVTRMWNAVCSALHRLGLNPQGPPM